MALAVALGYGMQQILLHPLNMAGTGYAFWSGIAGSFLTGSGIWTGLYMAYRRHNCAEHGCWRIAHFAHPHHGHNVCKRHMPNEHIPGHPANNAQATASASTPDLSKGETRMTATTDRQSGLCGKQPAKKTGIPFLHEITEAIEALKLPASVDVSHGFVEWLMLGNGPDSTLTINGGKPVGDCFFAAIFHGLMVKALVEQPDGTWAFRPEFQKPTANLVVGLYLGYQRGLAPGKSATSGPDCGTVVADGLAWFQAAGLIKRYGPVDHTNPTAVKQAVGQYKGVIVGITLDQDAEAEFEQGLPWRELKDPSVGGHAIYQIAYNPTEDTFVTWGADQKATLAWDNGQVDEAWWFQAPWEADPTGVDLQRLDLAIASEPRATADPTSAAPPAPASVVPDVPAIDLVNLPNAVILALAVLAGVLEYLNQNTFGFGTGVQHVFAYGLLVLTAFGVTAPVARQLGFDIDTLLHLSPAVIVTVTTLAEVVGVGVSSFDVSGILKGIVLGVVGFVTTIYGPAGSATGLPA